MTMNPIEHPPWPSGSKPTSLWTNPIGPKASIFDDLPTEHLTGSQKDIAEVCDETKALLLEKNRKYGDSALNPVRIVSKSDALEQIRVRIDDKLNRIKNAQSDEDEDVLFDLLGYLVLYRVAIKQKERRESKGE